MDPNKVIKKNMSNPINYKLQIEELNKLVEKERVIIFHY